MIVFSSALILERSAAEVADLPVILWENLVTVSNIVADQENADFPASNLANPQTNSLWKSGSTADQSLVITLSGATKTSAIGIARHNWGSGLVVVTINGTVGGVPSIVAGPQLLGDDTPALFVFEDDYYTELEIALEPGSVEPQAAVIYAGLGLDVIRSVQPGFQPIKYARDRDMVSQRAMNGDFVGTVILSEALRAPLEFRLFEPDWYWDEMQPFVDQAHEPFFIALFPDSDDSNVAYCWATNNPKPVVSQFTEEVDIAFQLEGLAL
jgi:hypothetical protein